MRILATGRTGQVVSALKEAASRRPEIDLAVAGRPELDLTDEGSIAREIRAARPDLVVSAAAYTAVDRAEDEPELARAVNALAAGSVARAAAEVGAAVIHLSTDYVFAGTGTGAYGEADATGPRSVYGRTKLEGEALVALANPRHLILRTAWVYSPFGRNFVKTMLGLARTRDTVAVVSDQWGNPTSAADIADGILHIAAALAAGNERFGVFHLSGTGSTNWSGLAEFVFAASARLGGPSANVHPITTAEFPTRASRPANSRLSNEKLRAQYGWQAPHWQTSCEAVMRRLLASN